jgi:hypothetical protein
MHAMDKDHARDNAKGWAGTIAELVAAMECDYDRLEELRDERSDLQSAIADALQEFEDNTARAYDEVSAEDIAADAKLITLASQILDKRAALTDWDAANGEELAELTASATLDGELCTDGDAARERIQEAPLSVQIRSGWTSPGDPMEAEEFEILLSTGGPALRIRGELDQHKEPCRAWLEYQDWGIPWTEYHGDGCEHETLLTFCRQFFFGE